MRRTSWVKTRHSLHPRVEVAIWPLPNANRRAGSGPSFDGLTPLRDAGAPALSAARPRKPNKACKRARRERESERERERDGESKEKHPL